MPQGMEGGAGRACVSHVFLHVDTVGTSAMSAEAAGGCTHPGALLLAPRGDSKVLFLPAMARNFSIVSEPLSAEASLGGRFSFVDVAAGDENFARKSSCVPASCSSAIVVDAVIT